MPQAELTAVLTSLRNELKKEFVVYDGSQRPIQYFQAHINAGDTEPCLLTTIEYVGVTTRIEKSRETIGAWSAAYDI